MTEKRSSEAIVTQLEEILEERQTPDRRKKDTLVDRSQDRRKGGDRREAKSKS
jgi:hypothetical protein